MRKRKRSTVKETAAEEKPATKKSTANETVANSHYHQLIKGSCENSTQLNSTQLCFSSPEFATCASATLRLKNSDCQDSLTPCRPIQLYWCDVLVRD